MEKVRAQIVELHKDASDDEQRKMILGAARQITILTVKAMAMDINTITTIVQAALKEKTPKKGIKEPEHPTMPLTESIKALFKERARQMAVAPVGLQTKLDKLEKRDHAELGTNAQSEHVKELALHLCNELNSNNPLSTPVLAFLTQVNRSKILGQTIEVWTLSAWKEEFSNYNARTPTGMDPVILAVTKKNPSLASAVRSGDFGITELVHKVAHTPLIEELPNIPETARGKVVRALFEGKLDDAYNHVLAYRKLELAETLVVGGNFDTSALDAAGFVV